MIQEKDRPFIQSIFPFWEHLSASQRELIFANSKALTYRSGQALHCSSDCVGVLLIRSGSIRTYITSEEGREITLYRLDAGDICILSASCVLDSITFDVFIDAETDCDIIQLCPNAFAKLTAQNVYAELFSYKLAAERFSDVMWAFQEILFTSFDKRLAAFLVDESTKTGSDTIHMTHEQIARYLGSAREVVSRMLKYFSTEGLVSLSRGGVTLLDKKRLRRLL